MIELVIAIIFALILSAAFTFFIVTCFVRSSNDIGVSKGTAKDFTTGPIRMINQQDRI